MKAILGVGALTFGLANCASGPAAAAVDDPAPATPGGNLPPLPTSASSGQQPTIIIISPTDISGKTYGKLAAGDDGMECGEYGCQRRRRWRWLRDLFGMKARQESGGDGDGDGDGDGETTQIQNDWDWGDDGHDDWDWHDDDDWDWDDGRHRRRDRRHRRRHRRHHRDLQDQGADNDGNDDEEMPGDGPVDEDVDNGPDVEDDGSGTDGTVTAGADQMAVVLSAKSNGQQERLQLPVIYRPMSDERWSRCRRTTIRWRMHGRRFRRHRCNVFVKHRRSGRRVRIGRRWRLARGERDYLVSRGLSSGRARLEFECERADGGDSLDFNSDYFRIRRGFDACDRRGDDDDDRQKRSESDNERIGQRKRGGDQNDRYGRRKRQQDGQWNDDGWSTGDEGGSTPSKPSIPPKPTGGRWAKFNLLAQLAEALHFI